jgi:hypothetical protein
MWILTSRYEHNLGSCNYPKKSPMPKRLDGIIEFEPVESSIVEKLHTNNGGSGMADQIVKIISL